MVFRVGSCDHRLRKAGHKFYGNFKLNENLTSRWNGKKYNIGFVKHSFKFLQVTVVKPNVIF